VLPILCLANARELAKNFLEKPIHGRPGEQKCRERASEEPSHGPMVWRPGVVHKLTACSGGLNG